MTICHRTHVKATIRGQRLPIFQWFSPLLSKTLNTLKKHLWQFVIGHPWKPQFVAKDCLFSMNYVPIREANCFAEKVHWEAERFFCGKYRASVGYSIEFECRVLYWLCSVVLSLVVSSCWKVIIGLFWLANIKLKCSPLQREPTWVWNLPKEIFTEKHFHWTFLAGKH